MASALSSGKRSHSVVVASVNAKTRFKTLLNSEIRLTATSPRRGLLTSSRPFLQTLDVTWGRLGDNRAMGSGAEDLGCALVGSAGLYCRWFLTAELHNIPASLFSRITVFFSYSDVFDQFEDRL